METRVFDGKAFAQKKKENLTSRVSALKAEGIVPHLVSFLLGEDPASHLYTKLKKQFAQDVGCTFTVVTDPDIRTLISLLNQDTTVTGIMLQLPLPPLFREKTNEYILALDPAKDVDGLRSDSPFLPATVRGIAEIMKEAAAKEGDRVCIIGANGEVGRRLSRALKSHFVVSEVDIDTKNSWEVAHEAQIVISATGNPDSVDERYIQDGAIVIDVGSPKGDIVFSEVSKKAAFITPVPGGVGPVTVSSLIENLVDAAEALLPS